MSSPKVIHLIVSEPEQRVAGGYYTTLCGLLQEHAILPATELRTRYVCAMCQNQQNLELAKGLEDLRTRYNTHLTQSHLKESTDEQH